MNGTGTVVGGAFRLEALIGAGGMGQVWRAEHLPTGERVAVKTLGIGDPAPDWEDAFRHEVQAVARLEHSNVVAVLDAGMDGTPWLAMELTTGGTLSTAAPSDWSGISSLLGDMLRGLALAHARGVVHRDLKPSNVLLGAPGDPRPGWKLADFGIARLSYEGRDARPESGTPGFMAPEQLRGDWRRVGPATDLYALGCIAWWLVAGERLYAGEIGEVVYGHLSLPLPILSPRLPIPDGFEDWLRHCLDKEPTARFSHAAHALSALDALAAPPDGLNNLPGSVPDDATRTVANAPMAAPRPESEPKRTPAQRSPIPPLPPEPIAQGFLPGRALLGAGRGLYALRTQRLVGRQEQTRALWRAAVRSDRSGDAELVVLRGPSGAGKSALAEWLVRAVHEAGGSGIRAVHQSDGAQDGLGTALRIALGAHGLDRGALAEHLLDWGRPRGCTPRELGQLLERLAPAPSNPQPTALPQVRLTDLADRHAVVNRVLQWLAGEGASVVWLDDLQWGGDAMRWVESVLDGRGPLVVATVQTEALAEDPIRSAELDALYRRPEVRVLDIGPLPRDQWQVLVRGLLGLSRSLAQRVEERTQGNPLFAQMLVGDWVARDLLEVGEDGFRLRPGATVEIPDDLSSVWEKRIGRLVDGASADGVRALWIASLLGVEIELEEWEAACAEASVDPRAAPMERATRAALVHSTSAGWAFVHGMLREALTRQIPTDERATLHEACGRALTTRNADYTLSERIARHLVAAGRIRRALRPLWMGALARQRNLDFSAAESLLDERDRHIADLALPASDLAHSEGWVQRGRLWATRGETVKMLAHMDRALEHAREHGFNQYIAAGMTLTGSHMAMAGRAEEADALMDEIEPLLDSPGLQATALTTRASAAIYRRNYDRALELIHSALPLDAGPNAHAELHRLELAVYAFRSQVAEAERVYRHIVDTYTDIVEGEVANAHESMGVMHHVRGEWDKALACYEQASDAWIAMGGDAPNARLNIALVRAHLGELDGLSERVAELRAYYPDKDVGRQTFLVAVEVRIAATTLDAKGLDAATDDLQDRLKSTGLVDTDFAGLMALAATDAEARGLDGSRLRAISTAQRQALDL